MLSAKCQVADFPPKNVWKSSTVWPGVGRSPNVILETEKHREEEEINQTVWLDNWGTKRTCSWAEGSHKKGKAVSNVFCGPLTPVCYRMCGRANGTPALVNAANQRVWIRERRPDYQSSYSVRSESRKNYREDKGQRNLASSRTSGLKEIFQDIRGP